MRILCVLAAMMLLSGCILTDEDFGFHDDFDDPGFGDQFDKPTSRGARTDAFSFPVPNMRSERERDFLQGRALFEFEWSPEEVGPVFNDISCAGCHQLDGRGTPTSSALLFRLSMPDGSPEPTYGGQFQPRGVRRTPGEGQVEIFERLSTGEYPGGGFYTLRRPEYRFTNLGYGPMARGVQISPRLAQQTIGLGLLEAIDTQDILDLADPDDTNEDGISGRPNFVFDVAANDFALGRFGWKANQPSLRQQNAGAFNGDLGMTSSLFPESPCTDAQTACSDEDFGGRELRSDPLDKVTLYTQLIAPPGRKDWTSDNVVRGEVLFKQMNCTGCHIEEFITGSHELVELTNQRIRPYTDLLLHDMGPELADNRPDFEASGTEWRTPPLWGVGYLREINGHTRLMHDGRANGVEEAILWHGGEAARSKTAFMALSRKDREALVDFVETL